jgi:hypothetical protein
VLPVDPLELARFTTGQVISPGTVRFGDEPGSKENLNRPFDVHAERNLGCTDCHYSANNPVYFQGDGIPAPHLVSIPRRLELGEYLEQPSHEFASGRMRSMRRCGAATAWRAPTWLPYKTATQAMSCETCHIPKQYAPAFEQVDWTVLTPAGDPA